MEYGFSPKQLLERMKNMLVNESIVWLSVEDARVWGCNCVYFTIRVEPYLPGAAAVFEFVPSIEKFVPIAIVVLLPSDVELSKISCIAKKIPLYVFGSGDAQGAIIPLDEDGVPDFITHCLKLILKELRGIEDFEPVIDGYYIDLLRY